MTFKIFRSPNKIKYIVKKNNENEIVILHGSFHKLKIVISNNTLQKGNINVSKANSISVFDSFCEYIIAYTKFNIIIKNDSIIFCFL